MLTATEYHHIILDENGVAFLADSNTKVIEVVLDQMAYGWSAEEMHRQHPHLSLAQIHSALAYYWDHQDELDAEIQSRIEIVNEIRERMGEPTPLVARLRAEGLLD